MKTRQQAHPRREGDDVTTKPRLSSFRHQGVPKYGLVVADGIVDLSKRHPQWQSLREVIEAGALVSLSEEGAAL